MEQLLSCSRHMRYAQANKNQPAVPMREQMKVVIITPSVRIPRNLIRCESEGSGHSFDREKNDTDDMEDVASLRQHQYQPRKSWTPPGYGDDD